MAITTGSAAQLSEDISRHFFQEQRNPLRIYHDVYDYENEYGRVKALKYFLSERSPFMRVLYCVHICLMSEFRKL
jgi:hypothetical protein